MVKSLKPIDALELIGFVKQYKSFFTEQFQNIEKLLPEDDPIGLHCLEAIGCLSSDKLDEISRAIIVDQETPSSLLKKSENFYFDARLRTAFFYYTIGNLARGLTIEETVDDAYSKLQVYHIDGGYQIHKLHPENLTNNPLAIFLDWDLNVEKGTELKPEIHKFLEHFFNQKDEDGKRKYMLAITSSNPELMKRVTRYPSIIPYLDAITTVPGTAQNIHQDKDFFAGKIYTNLCDRLGVKNYRAIIVTDDWADRSVETQNPIVTLVTPYDTSASYWITAIEYLEELGERATKGEADFVFAECMLNHKDPKDILISPDNPNTKWMIHQVKDFETKEKKELYLLQHASLALNNCIFLYPGSKTPTTLPEMRMTERLIR